MFLSLGQRFSACIHDIVMTPVEGVNDLFTGVT